MPNEAHKVMSGDVFIIMCAAENEHSVRGGMEKIFVRGLCAEEKEHDI
jgi:hypothetical protein